MSEIKQSDLVNLKNSYTPRKGIIRKRLNEFKEVFRGSDKKIFAELCFCICTPQSNAKACDRAISGLVESGELYAGSERRISYYLKGVRFHRNKAGFIVSARKFFSGGNRIRIKEKIREFRDNEKLREWLVKNVTGIGFKEASHFLRNIGLGKNRAILDRHILKNLKNLGVIDEIPKNISGKKYIEIENKMCEFSRKIGIPMDELDLLLWSEETGEVFK